ncbi:hypothetical protein HDV00_008799 [Rhizophlyctis rosea]|nr:hypothetical protein HDV00_008799 [Rhizophlyctis rosea]
MFVRNFFSLILTSLGIKVYVLAGVFIPLRGAPTAVVEIGQAPPNAGAGGPLIQFAAALITLPQVPAVPAQSPAKPPDAPAPIAS